MAPVNGTVVPSGQRVEQTLKRRETRYADSALCGAGSRFFEKEFGNATTTRALQITRHFTLRPGLAPAAGRRRLGWQVACEGAADTPSPPCRSAPGAS